MISKYNYENGVKIRIWQDEFQTFDLRPIKIIEKEFTTANENIGLSKLMAVEVCLPKNSSNYAMLGVKYEGCDESKILVDVFDFDTEEFSGNLGVKPDNIQLGLPEDYVAGVFKGFEKILNSGLLRKGKYRVFIGAHGEVGSSVNIFDYTCRVLMRLLIENDINTNVVENVIKSEL